MDEHSEFEHDVLTGEVDVKTIRRPAIKITRGKPMIGVCIPVGTKDQISIFETPDNKKWAQEPTIVPGVLPMQWVIAHMNLLPPLGVMMSYFMKTGMRSAMARQVMTTSALQSVDPNGYLLFWDDDVLPPQKGLYTLFNYMQQNPDVGIASGVYTTRENPVEPMVYAGLDKGAYWGFSVGPDAVPEDVFSVGAGFMLVRAKAIQAITKLYPDTPVWVDEKAMMVDANGTDTKVTWGHDIRFCRLMHEAGYRVVIDGRVNCEHFDAAEQKAYFLPPDSAPVRRGKNINTAQYWDQVYGREGADSWRKYPEMFDKVIDEVPWSAQVLELGCGVGILGSRLTAQRGSSYTGYDISPTAIEMARSRFLVAEVKAVKDLDVDDFEYASILIATELVEHLDADDVTHLVNLITMPQSEIEKFIFTTPDNCWGPDEVPEHQALFNEDKIREVVKPLTDAGWTLTIEKADENHLIAVVCCGRNSDLRAEVVEAGEDAT